MTWLAYCIGAFYLLGGLAALRQARLNLLLDKALAAANLVSISRDDRIVAVWMFVAAALTVSSGISLLLLSRWAVLLFGLCWLSQAAYLIWAVQTRDYGRMATIHAFGIYTVATLTVTWMARTGVLG